MNRFWLGTCAAAALTLAAVLMPRPATVEAKRGGAAVSDEAKAGGLEFRLGDGGGESQPYERVPAASTERLGDGETARVLQRLTPLAPEPQDKADFALREQSLPAPRTGVTVQEPFPPPSTGASAPDVAAGPLSVLRKLPTGDVPLAPHVSVTFSQPMVAVTSVAQTQQVQPVELSPQPAGRWRWIGTKTVLFESDPRLPMATEYAVKVPAGTRSATGGSLAKAESFSFRTPPVTLVTRYPEGGPARRDTLLFLAFDQAIDAQALLPSLSVRAGSTRAKLRLATPQELEADESVRALARAAEPRRFLVLRPEAPLPSDSQVDVTVEAGAPSAEGPRRTSAAQSFGFRTYGPLRVKESHCGWNDQPCRPFMPWQIELTNPLDAKAFKKEMVRVEPELRGLKVNVYGTSIGIQGASRGRTRYKVTLSAALPDVFGQTLEQPETLTFDVGTAEPSLSWSGGDFIVLDPAAKPGVSVYTVNVPELRVEAWGVEPSDWRAHLELRGRRWDKSASVPGRKLLSTTVKPKGEADELTETRVDLGSVFPSGLGHALVRIEPTVQPKEEWRRMGFSAWVQGTRIGLSAFADGGELLGWASALTDGQPLGDVELALEPGGPRGKTDAAGLAHLPLGSAAAGAPLLVARRGNDTALLPETPYWWNGQQAWRGTRRGDRLAWYVADDRGLYRPGEDVHVKGFLRQIAGGPKGDVDLLQGPGELAYALRDSRGNEVTKGTTRLDALGGFDLLLKLPPTMNLGQAALQLEASGAAVAQGSFQHAFQVQEFRRPEFEVTASASEGPHVVGGHAEVSLAATYYAGGGLPGADVDWQVRATPSSYTPPGRSDYVFGTWVPWWDFHSRPEPQGTTRAFKGRTDGSGKHALRVDFDAVTPPRPTSVSAEGTVADVNRQAFTGTAALLVHPALLYVGLRSERLFVQQGEPLVVNGIVSDIEGALVAGRKVSMRAERLDWEQEAGAWVEKVADTQACELTSAADAQTCRFTTPEGGVYRVTARVVDDRGRPNETQLRLWVAGGKLPQRRNVEQEKVELIPDKKEYQPGETAEILVLSPFSPAEGLVTLRREGLLRSERFRFTGSSYTLKLPVEDGFTPNVQVQVDLNGAAERGAPDAQAAGKAALPKRPAFASGQLDISVPPLKRTLALEVTPRDKRLEPGGKTSVGVTLRDASGQPVSGGQVAVIVADEAVLALTRYALPDPLGVFYPRRSDDVSDHYSRPYVVLGRLEDLDLTQLQQQELEELKTLGYEGAVAKNISGGAVPPPPASMPAGRAMKMAAPQAMTTPGPAAEAAPEPIRVRTDFNALALFAAALPTDGRGHAEVALQLPDSLTRYRVMAVAVAGGKQYGSGEASVQARLPLMVRPSPPRFLNFGDRFELPVVLQNQTDAALEVQVAVRATNAELSAGAGRRLSVPANDRVEVRFPAAALMAGTARFQVAAVSGRFADAAEFKLPVWTPATTEAFATYGTLDQGAVAQPVAAPPGVVPSFGGLEVTTSSTALQALTDAVLYLSAYPFECSEQLASRVLAVAALRDVLTAFEAEGLPEPKELIAAVERDLGRLRAMQNEDGGFGFWRRGDEPWPYLGVHVAHAFERARAKGFKVPDETWSRSQAYLRGVEKRIPSWYGDEARRTLIAYALYVRLRMGDPDPGRARKLIAEAGLEKLSFEALGWLLPVLAADPAAAQDLGTIRKHLANRVEETAGAAHFVVAYGDGAHLLLHSDRRADAVLLEALIATDPQNDLIPKLVTGLMAHRKAGRWGNTQENTFVLLALDRYFGAYERTTPDFVARLWLGERFAGEQAYRGRSTERHLLEVPMAVLAQKHGPQPLTIAKEGPGRLYYRIGLRYAPAALKLEALDAGFAVERSYAAVDDAKDVRRDPDGTWRVRAGARVRVKLSLVAPARRYHVALVDPLPAGLEPLNPTLATTGSLPPGDASDVTVAGAPGVGGPGRPGPSFWWWTRPWFEHQNLRDERVEAFSSLLWEGVWSYSYVARATTPGSFVVPPTKAEEMYAPETFGRSSSDRLIVE